MQISRYSLLLVVLLLLLAACRREEEPERTYDLSPSRALLATGEQLLDSERASSAVPSELLAQLEATAAGRALAGALREQQSQHALVAEANRLLVEERYNDLAELLERAQREGLATSQLLELTGLPQALQALRLYCARRPYEHAADLEQNLEFLRPWVRQLQALSPAFQVFYQEQQSQLLAMRQQEAAVAEERILHRLDWLLASARQTSQAGDFLAQSAAEFPQLPILRLLSRVGEGWQPGDALRQPLASAAGFLARASTREKLSLELSIALCWNDLDDEAKEHLRAEWKNSTTATLTGTFLRAKCLRDTALFEAAIAQWQAQASPEELLRDAPAFLGDYLDCFLADAPDAKTWAAAAPDFSSILTRLLQSSK